MPATLVYLRVIYIQTETTDNLWLGLTPRDSASFQWQSTGGLVSTTNWASGGPGSSSLTADSAVVMTGNSSWTWEVVSQSGLAKVVCQRGEYREREGERDRERGRERERERERKRPATLVEPGRLCLSLVSLKLSVREVSTEREREKETEREGERERQRERKRPATLVEPGRLCLSLVSLKLSVREVSTEREREGEKNRDRGRERERETGNISWTWEIVSQSGLAEVVC